ncbi:MAG: cyclically-permuted mutarotase family protein, partial [Bacteroidaceae bacterium]|nr:cyclically-permuted mutarotase family protein [Bacteroidaceae bacterium]
MKGLKRFSVLVLSLVISFSVYADKIKVACIGNSVTYGHLLPYREDNAYPARLQNLLGDNYMVGNFGKSGATLLNRGHRPYMEQDEFKEAMAFEADIAVIHLGLNDTDPRNWPNYSDDFEKDYYALIDSIKSANPKCEVWICKMSP